MCAMVAVIRRMPGGGFAKVPKSGFMPAVPLTTTSENLATYFQPWPKRKSDFLVYGHTHRASSSLADNPGNPYAAAVQDTSGSNELLAKNGIGGVSDSDADGGILHLYGPSPDEAAANAAPVAFGSASTGGFATCGRQPPSHGSDATASVKAQKSTTATPAAGTSLKALGIRGVMQRFKRGQKLSMVTAYDYPSARFARTAGAEIVLVGDSIGNCRLGLESTVGVTMSDMVRATTAVRRGVESAPHTWGGAEPAPKPVVVGDMPFGSYLSTEDALKNAAEFRMIGADLVKLEGGRRFAPMVRALTDAGIAVMAHIGLQPQSAQLQGGLRLQGTTAASALEILRDAKELADAGAVAMVVECVPAEVGRAVQAAVPAIPVIGIGAGPHVAGQVLVCDDLLGLHGMPPSFAKRYAALAQTCASAYEDYVNEVRSGAFPDIAHSRKMKPEELAKLRDSLVEAGADDPFLGMTVETTPLPRRITTTVAPTPPMVQKLPLSQGSGFSASQYVMQKGDAAFQQARLMSSSAGGGSGASSRLSAFMLPAAAVGALLFGCLPRAACEADAGATPQSAASKTAQLTAPKVVHTKEELFAWRDLQAGAGRRVAFVPTMGNLHKGHLELVNEAKKYADTVIVSIFVNPAQFAPNEDFDRYPRTLESDVKMLAEYGVAAVFAPKPKDIYPRGSPGGTLIVPTFVQGLSEDACRPHFFTGVATVCIKLFNLVSPDFVILGQKDAMQCAVLRRMLEDLHMDHKVQIVVAPTSREESGLAMSSRNSYLTASMRERAPTIYESLCSSVGRRGSVHLSCRY
eukprot:TRINITY_DN12890_c0_g1_i1.p1 TRINITY_DN12890_c0_g1~~TRINITY_DN12890_c0_g1_i1.p1  ORF type:complete len:803 (+),score=209.79 TRINITY_DN12890_c0_g1_i1:106-2514(+)